MDSRVDIIHKYVCIVLWDFLVFKLAAVLLILGMADLKNVT